MKVLYYKGGLHKDFKITIGNKYEMLTGFWKSKKRIFYYY